MQDVDLLGGYRLHMVRRGLVGNSITKIGGSLRLFHHSITPTPLPKVTTEQIEAFLDARRGRDGGPLTARTRYWWISTIHNFYEWAEREGHIQRDPTVRIVRPRLRRNLPRPSASADVALALDMADARMRCWLLLMAYEGLRCQEVAYIEREDVLDTMEPPMLLVRRGKGDKERMLPLHPDVAMALRSLPMPRGGRLWHVNPVYLSHRTNQHLHACGLDDTSHQLRHWFGTNFYRESGKDLRLTQDMMGHDSPTTTALYAKVVVDDAAPVVRSLTVRQSMALHPTALAAGRDDAPVPPP